MLRNPQPLSPRAYLALYMAVLTKRTNAVIFDKRWSPREKLLHAYLNYLPSYDDFASFHPLLTIDEPENSKNHKHMFYTDHLTQVLRHEMESEYQALCRATSSNGDQLIQIYNHQDIVQAIAWDDYVAARLQVLTRSFSAGPLTKHDSSDEELRLYSPHLTTTNGVDDSQTESLRHALSSAMVPLLDAFNHHVHPNVGWKYMPGSGLGSATGSSNSSSFTVFAAGDVQGGTQLMDTYGTKATDSRYV
jgi:hypothetical protein